MNGELNSGVYSLMQTGQPYKSYIKTILGKLLVNMLNPFDGKPESLIIKGNPKGAEKEDCIIDVWNEMGDVYFRRANKRHLETGYLIEYKRKEKEEKEKTVPEFSDEELIELLNSKYFTLQSEVNKLTSVAPAFRLLTLAKELDKSEKIIKLIEGKVSELQIPQFQQSKNLEENQGE